MDFILNDKERMEYIENQKKETRQVIADTYRACRKERGISQTTLSGLTGISQPNITRFESGRYNPTLDMMVRVAAAMGKKLTITLED